MNMVIIASMTMSTRLPTEGEFTMPNDKPRLVTSRAGHQMFVIKDGCRRWVPDLWTMRDLGISPADLEVIDDEELASLESMPRSLS